MSYPALHGTVVQLEPLHESHRAGLIVAADDPRIWPYIPQHTDRFNFTQWLAEAYAAQDSGDCVYTVITQDNQRVVGSTRFYDVATVHRRLQIGYTWYHPSVWGTRVNAECKLILLQHAFETLCMHRVGFSVDARNARSLAAVRKLGATEEGVLRKHMITQHGFVRDTVSFSIITAEWPHVKANLRARLAEIFKH